jgi:hypothetical protein
MAKHPIIKQLIDARNRLKMDHPEEILEIKRYAHADQITKYGDKAWTIKTRFNSMEKEGISIHEAKVGFPRNTTDRDYVPMQDITPLIGALEQHVHTTEELYNIRDKIEGRSKDILGHVEETYLNITPDYKRYVYADGTTRPWQSMTEYSTSRKAVDSLPKGTAWPEQVEQTVLRHDNGKRRIVPARFHNRQIAHRMILQTPGYRLPKGRTLSMAAKRLGISLRHIHRLAHERLMTTDWQPDPSAQQRIRDLGLW